MSNAPALRQSAPSDPIRHSAGPVVWLERLVLTDFRNYGRAEIHLDRRPVVLTGPNGAGKTNLLEAISFLIPGRGLRHARLPEIDRMISAETDGQPRRAAWGIAATVNRPEAQIDLGTGRDPAAAGGRDRRLVKIDGALASGQSALARILSVAWLTPQMDRLFLDGALHRRKFTDRLVFGLDPDHAKRLGQYDHLLQERVQVLRGEGERGARSRLAGGAGAADRRARHCHCRRAARPDRPPDRFHGRRRRAVPAGAAAAGRGRR